MYGISTMSCVCVCVNLVYTASLVNKDLRIKDNPLIRTLPVAPAIYMYVEKCTKQPLKQGHLFNQDVHFMWSQLRVSIIERLHCSYYTCSVSQYSAVDTAYIPS